MMFIREKYHPLFYLRKFWLFQQLTRLLDFPILIKIDHISFPIYGSLSKNLSLILSGGLSGEIQERQNFLFVVKELEI